MYTLALCVLLSTALAAKQLPAVFKRQDYSFEPSTIPGGCSAADGWAMCGADLCYLPSRGDVCCDPSSEWACPGGNFCLVDGLCCPDGLDPETCARDNGVTLPSDFNTSPAAASTPAPSTPAASSTGYSFSTPVAPYPTTAGNTTVVVPTGTTGGVTPTASSPPVFSGVANRIEGGVLVAGLVAAAELLL